METKVRNKLGDGLKLKQKPILVLELDAMLNQQFGGILMSKFETIEEVRRQVVYEPKVEYVVVEKKSDNDMFTLEEYRQMRAILEVIKENQKKA